MRPSLRLVVSVAVASLLVAACGGGDEFLDEPTPTTQPTPATTAAAPLDGTGDTATTAEVTTTTAVEATGAPDPGPVKPLTGLPGTPDDRPAVAIKIDNNSKARPQVGLNEADLLIEVIVESRLTRFIGVFHSTPSDPVGPVRSARTTDLQVLSALGQPLFANSGANDYTLNAIASSPDLVNANVNAFPADYFRDRTRSAPHNLFTGITALWDRGGDRGGRPTPIFEYLTDAAELPAGATDAAGLSLNYGNQRASYAWDAETAMWVRTQDGTPHVDAADLPVAAPNVVVLESQYGTSPADPISPEVIVVGNGRAWVFTQGTVQEGTWSRSSKTEPAVLTTAAGEPMLLTPGRTHLLLPRSGQVTIG